MAPIAWDPTLIHARVVPRFLRNNGLSVFLLVCFLVLYLGAQYVTGWRVHNEERREYGLRPIAFLQYSTSAHFWEVSTENWESEFLQMFIYIFVSTLLFQKGSAESNDPDAPAARRPVTSRSPWPVRRGGWRRIVYSHSLSLAFLALFLACFALHARSSQRLENEMGALAGRPAVSVGQHLGSSQFWFESFQNWQSEFLAIAAMVILSIFLREKNSPESKPVEAAHSETGA